MFTVELQRKSNLAKPHYLLLVLKNKVTYLLIVIRKINSQKKLELMKYLYTLSLFLFLTLNGLGQSSFYFGADLSYVNEMEDCGVTYSENGVTKDVYQIFEENGCNLVRLRKWHTPNWYDNLNNGQRYSDFADIKKSIQRAKMQGMEVMLDYHLSDSWTDPSNQLVPAAWANIVDSLSILKDSLYNYIYSTLLELHQQNLLPEMVQIGNETNKGILLSQSANSSGWVMDWNRNSQLFNSAILAIRDIETLSNKTIQVCIQIADPAEVDWMMSNFISHGVSDFEIIGTSYYHEWHGTTTITQVGNIVSNLIQNYNKEIMIVEAGYPWTASWNDNANNILFTTSSDYSPLSPSVQKEWLVDLTQEVVNNGGKGVIYWEPAWVSSTCSTKWAQGSHYENATFFDFNNNLQNSGGIGFMEHNYGISSGSESLERIDFKVYISDNHLIVDMDSLDWKANHIIQLSDMKGQLIKISKLSNHKYQIPVKDLNQGIYIFTLMDNNRIISTKKLSIGY